MQDGNSLEKKIKNPLIQEKFDKLNKCLSIEFQGERSLNSVTQDNDANDFREEEQDFQDERELEFLKYHKYFLTIKKPCKNLKEFDQNRLTSFLKESRIFFCVMLFFYTFESVVDFLIHMQDFSENQTPKSFLKFCVIIALFFLSFFGIEKLFHFFIMRMILVTFIFILFIVEIFDVLNESDKIMKDINFAVLFCPLIFLTNFSFFSFLEIFFINSSFFIAFLCVIIFSDIITLEIFVMAFMITVHNVIKMYFQLRLNLKSFNNLRSSHLKRAEQEEKISQLLPIHVKYDYFY